MNKRNCRPLLSNPHCYRMEGTFRMSHGQLYRASAAILIIYLYQFSWSKLTCSPTFNSTVAVPSVAIDDETVSARTVAARREAYQIAEALFTRMSILETHGLYHENLVVSIAQLTTTSCLLCHTRFTTYLSAILTMAFERYSIDHDDNPFPLLYQSVKWEDFSKGRQIAVLHRPENDSVPLIRSTTVYETPSQPFQPIHHTMIDSIRQATGIQDLELNNAMLEVYDSRYRTMNFHTDQALDLDPGSYICLFSCYEHGADSHPRVLTVKSKDNGEESEVQLLHHSVVVFSTTTNQKHLHKIEGRDLPRDHNNRWMGFTLRLAKTSVKIVDGVSHLMSGQSHKGELTIATDKERGAFFGLKGLENKGVDFQWPEIGYTISPSDLMLTTNQSPD